MKVKRCDFIEDLGDGKVLLLLILLLVVVYLFGLVGFKGKGLFLLLVCVDLDFGI